MFLTGRKSSGVLVAEFLPADFPGGVSAALMGNAGAAYAAFDPGSDGSPVVVGDGVAPFLVFGESGHGLVHAIPRSAIISMDSPISAA